MKKILSIALPLILIMAMITGCSLLGVLQNNQDGQKTAPKDNESSMDDSIDDDDSTPLAGHPQISPRDFRYIRTGSSPWSIKMSWAPT